MAAARVTPGPDRADTPVTSKTVDYFAADGQEPRRAEPGDLYVTTRTVYRVLSTREVDSRLWHDRWRVELEFVAMNTPGVGILPAYVDESIARFGSCHVHHMGSYERGEKPRDHARAHGYDVGPLPR